MSQRVLFERALREENISGSSLKRKGEESGFPKEYLDKNIELAWKMWNAALGNKI